MTEAEQLIAPAAAPEPADALEAALAKELGEDPKSDFVPSVFDYFETDLAIEEEGKWFNDIRKGMNFKMRRLSSKASMAVRDRAITMQRKKSRNGQLTPEDHLKITRLQMAYGVIIDWSGKAMRDREDKPIPFSPQAAHHLLTQMPHLFEELARLAFDLDSFRAGQLTELEGNS